MLLFGSQQALGLALHSYAANKEVLCEQSDQTIGLQSNHSCNHGVYDAQCEEVMVETRRRAG